jgi:hypothetical protein
MLFQGLPYLIFDMPVALFALRHCSMTPQQTEQRSCSTESAANAKNGGQLYGLTEAAPFHSGGCYCHAPSECLRRQRNKSTSFELQTPRARRRYKG